MCGIIAAFGIANAECDSTRQAVLQMSREQRHRGPDWNAIYQRDDVFLAHERLAINDLSESGDQPMVRGDTAWVVNGEIYNHRELRTEFDLSLDVSSDSAVVGELYAKIGEALVSKLDGMFSFALYDFKTGRFLVARDHMGIIPLYIGYEGAAVWFASEMKCLLGRCDRINIFPPGHMYIGGGDVQGMRRWYEPIWQSPGHVPTGKLDLAVLRNKFTRAVQKQLMSDAPLGVLLSGGLDSSLVSAIAMRSRTTPLHSFSIGLIGSPDLAAAQKVADHLGTKHHSFTFTVQEGLDCLRDLIWHLESWEQVRASVPMYLLARKIRSLGIKVVLSGEGADEMFAGYLYFAEAPDTREMQAELVRKTTRLHQWDVLRANKSTQAFGLEARPPFLDKDFLDYVMSIDPEHKMIRPNERDADGRPRIEKYILRKAFDVPEDPYLPESVLWRQKEQFSDGVGYSWVDKLREYCDATVTDEQFAARAERFPYHPPQNKEYYLLRSIFESKFVDGIPAGESTRLTIPVGKSIACSTPEAMKWNPEWEKTAGDISGRAVAGHNASSEFKFEDEHVREAKKVSTPTKKKNMKASNTIESPMRVTEIV